jgi:hypothetical protein
LTDWYGIRRRNISDGNATTFFRSFWIRWTITGMAMAARPARNRGVRNPIIEPS